MTGRHETTDTKLLTVKDVAERLSVSTSLVYQLVESGKLPVHRIGNGRGAIRFSPQDIETYLEECRVEKQAPATRQRRPRLKHIQL